MSGIKTGQGVTASKLNVLLAKVQRCGESGTQCSRALEKGLSDVYSGYDCSLMQVRMHSIHQLKLMARHHLDPLRGARLQARGRDGGQLLWMRKFVIQPIEHCCGMMRVIFGWNRRY